MTGVRDVLEQLRGEPVWYLMSPGNAGDALISVGFFDLARDVGLEYAVTTDPSLVPLGATVVVNGGGGLVPEWQGSIGEDILRACERSSRLVLLPQSVRGSEELLSALPVGTVVFVREQRSLDHVGRHVGSGVTVLIDDDMALHADVERLLTADLVPWWRVVRSPKDAARVALYLRCALMSSVRRTVIARRGDAEAAHAGHRGLAVLNDLSIIASFGASDERECRSTAARLARLVDRYRHIETDRLHVAITAALLGKKVTMHEGSYYKLRGVYEYSLLRMPHVRFAGD